jgi:hypothetical protein
MPKEYGPEKIYIGGCVKIRAEIHSLENNVWRIVSITENKERDVIFKELEDEFHKVTKKRLSRNCSPFQ